MKPKWEYYEKNEKIIQDIQQKYNINKILATVLSNRGLNEKNIKIYLNPTRNDFHNPFEMPDMEEAVQRIIKAIKNKEKIIIYGDYDVDGITSITVLKKFFQDLEVQVMEYIPNRLEEGYGLNKNAIAKIGEGNYTLMITVDCGITAIDEIEYAKQFGIDTIVTDHHESGNNIPDAVAVVDCKRKDSKYKFRELAGVGVAFKLCQAISQKLELNEKSYLKYLDIVALGTIADIVPLVDENRVITKLGMMLIRQTRNYGLAAILNLIGYKKIDSSTISFGIAPRINACGRMGCANEALELLLSKNKQEAIEKATNISKYNVERQKYEKIIYNDAIKQIEEKNLEAKNSIVLGGKNWNSGVVGIVASKLTELYYRPCLLICYEDDQEIGKGSGRSIEDFDLHNALTQCKDLLEGYGGHSMAVGFKVKESNLPKLQQRFEQLAEASNVNSLQPVIKIDLDISIDDISIDIIESLDLLEPLGEANKMPIFAIKNLKIDSIRALSEGKHLKLSLKNDKNSYINAIGFNLGHYTNEFVIGDRVNVAGVLEINSFNGVNSIQINLKDIIKTI